MKPRATTASLVLGSGGARGLAHIGVIQWLTEQGFEIRSIAGSSIGALHTLRHLERRSLRRHRRRRAAAGENNGLTVFPINWKLAPV